LPASSATGAIVTGLQVPECVGTLEPVLNSELGWPFASVYRPTITMLAVLAGPMYT
jgi:hypothetical protein